MGLYQFFEQASKIPNILKTSIAVPLKFQQKAGLADLNPTLCAQTPGI